MMKYDNGNSLKLENLDSPWLEMEKIDWTCISEHSTLKNYPKGSIVYHQEDNPEYVYLVKSGRVCLDIYGLNGEKRSIFIAETNTFFGELSPIDNLPNLCSATVVSDASLYLIPKGVFDDELNKNPAFSTNLLKVMAKKIRLLTAQLKQLSFNDSTYRVCHALMNLTCQYGAPVSNGKYKLKIKFTHQEMANLTGLSRVSVSNILLNLTAEGIIDKEDGYIVINDISLLHSLLWDIGY